MTTRAGRVRLHQRHGHAARAGVELLVSHHELRLPAQGSAARPTSRASAAAASARAASTCSSARSTNRFRGPGARAWPRAGPTSPTATPTPWSSPSTARRPGGEVKLDAGRATVTVKAKVAFAAETCRSARRSAARRRPGNDAQGRADRQRQGGRDEGGAGRRQGARPRRSTCRSRRAAGWRCGTSRRLHTNPVNVIVGGKPIRARKESAKWCIGVIEQLWRVRAQDIAAAERPEAEQTFKKATEIYRQNSWRRRSRKNGTRMTRISARITADKTKTGMKRMRPSSSLSSSLSAV